ncbi:MAG: hypothetical protein JW849_01425 [Phycisphaerae bacterium]|nr:hypothetical protein [Phycisphaerae bacterium]
MVSKSEKMDPVEAASKWVDPYRTWAAVGSMLLGAATVVATVYLLLAGVAPGDVAVQVILILLGATSLCAGAVLRFGSPAARKQALWILLVYWLLVALAGTLQIFASLLWDGWSLLPAAQGWAFGLAIAEVVFGALLAMLLFRAAAPRSPDRYGANVTISVAVVLAVVVVLNMLAFSAPYEHDFETLGLFGLSERSRRIVSEVETPLHIWAVYTDARMSANTESQRQVRNAARNRLERVMELLEEMHRANPNIQVRDASGDAARADLMAELRALQQGKTGPQEDLLQKARQEIPAILRELEAMRDRWSSLPKESYLAQWDLGGAMADVLSDRSEKIETADRAVAQATATSPLPDYVKLLGDLIGELRTSREILQTNGEILQHLGALPEKIRANAPRARKSVDEVVKAVRELQGVVRGGGKEGPSDPAKALKEFSAVLSKAGQSARDASKELQAVAGSDAKDVRLVSVSRAWQVDVPSRRYEGMIERTTRGQLFEDLADDLQALRSQTAVVSSDANQAAQRRFVVEMRPQVEQLIEGMKQYQSAVEEGLRQLTTLDNGSKALLAEAGQEKAFAPLQAKIAPLLEEYDSLKAPKDDALPPDLSGKNIIVLRAGEKVEVVTFEETWPSRVESAAGDSESSRFFNGDAALASRILAMTKRRPFGRVLIAYLEPTLPPELRMRIRLPQGDIPPSQLTELTRRLKDSGFLVQNWNLEEDLPPQPAEDAAKSATQPATKPAGKADALPTILLVVPPAPPMPPLGPGRPPLPGFGPEHLQKIRDAVDDGASAMFLVCNLRPQMLGFGMPIPQQYPFAEYLRNVWGLEARTGHLLVEGIASETPGEYQINPVKTSYMPIRSFTSQPIGRPLQGRRMIWSGSCPITDAPEAPQDVARTAVLVVPETMTNIWATGDVQRLAGEIEKSRGGLVRPQYDKGDLKVPLTLATAAARAGDLAKGIAPSRLVILGVGLSFTDAFLANPIPLLTDQGGFETAPAPRDNLDLAVNAAYWLVGKESYIAAGPTSVEPVRAMGPVAQTTVWVLCVLILPAAAIAAGLIVMSARRRS